jgi:hypothetical protein
MAKDPIDQDALAAQWGVALEAEQNAAAGDIAVADGQGAAGAEARAALMGEHGR